MPKSRPDMLSQEYLNSILEYRDGMLFHKVNRGKMRVGQRAGSTGKRYRNMRILGKIYFEHRVVFTMHHGYCPEYLDHIDGNPMNNRIENLRAATLSQNAINSATKCYNKHGAKHLTYDKRSDFWYVKMRVNGKPINFGCFKQKDDAIAYANMVRPLVHGEFSCDGRRAA